MGGRGGNFLAPAALAGEGGGGGKGGVSCGIYRRTTTQATRRPRASESRILTLGGAKADADCGIDRGMATQATRQPRAAEGKIPTLVTLPGGRRVELHRLVVLGAFALLPPASELCSLGSLRKQEVPEGTLDSKTTGSGEGKGGGGGLNKMEAFSACRPKKQW